MDIITRVLIGKPKVDLKSQPSRWAVLWFEHRKWADERTEWCNPGCRWASDVVHDETCLTAQNSEMAYLKRGETRIEEGGWD